MPRKTPAHSPPAWLGPIGRKKWTELRARLGNLDDERADALALLCASWDAYLSALKDVRDNGQTLIGETGRAFVNPAVNIITEERKSILKISKLLGLSPEAQPAKKSGAGGGGKWSKLLDG